MPQPQPCVVVGGNGEAAGCQNTIAATGIGVESVHLGFEGLLVSLIAHGNVRRLCWEGACAVQMGGLTHQCLPGYVTYAQLIPAFH